MDSPNIQYLEILDSRGVPTLECTINFKNISVSASVPSGKSVSLYEAQEKRDNDPARYHGKGLKESIAYYQPRINKLIRDKDILCQEEIDVLLRDLDPHKEAANFTLATSLAICRLNAQHSVAPLYKHIASLHKTTPHTFPQIMVNILNGGAHADNHLSIQEFMIVSPPNMMIDEAIRMASETFHALKNVLHNKNLSTNVGDEGGFAPMIDSTDEVLSMITHILPSQFKIALDCAAHQFHAKGGYNLDGVFMSFDQYGQFLDRIASQYPIVSIEDPVSEESWDQWKAISKLLNHRLMVVGDDVFATSKTRLKNGIEDNVANAILIKPNQIGTLTETLETIECAQKNNYKVVVSHRSGETTDTFIADLAVGVNADFVKFGSVSRGERTCKYNRLLNIFHNI